jgi:hypothetical protein
MSSIQTVETSKIEAITAPFPNTNGVICDSPLFVARVEDRRTIAASVVVTLTVQRCRVMNLEEKLQQPPVADPLRIEHNVDCFRMGSVITVGCVGHVAARRRQG